MRQKFLHDLISVLLSDPTLETKRHYQKTKNTLLSPYKGSIEDPSLVEVLTYYRD